MDCLPRLLNSFEFCCGLQAEPPQHGIIKGTLVIWVDFEEITGLPFYGPYLSVRSSQEQTHAKNAPPEGDTQGALIEVSC